MHGASSLGTAIRAGTTERALQGARTRVLALWGERTQDSFREFIQPRRPGLPRPGWQEALAYAVRARAVMQARGPPHIAPHSTPYSAPHSGAVLILKQDPGRRGQLPIGHRKDELRLIARRGRERHPREARRRMHEHVRAGKEPQVCRRCCSEVVSPNA